MYSSYTYLYAQKTSKSKRQGSKTKLYLNVLFICQH